MNHLKRRAADGLLCLCLSAAMTPVICSGFVLEDPWTGNGPLVFLLCAVVQLVLLLVAHNRLTTFLGIAVAAAAAAAAMLWARSEALFSRDAEYGPYLFLLIGVLTCVLVYLLTRTRAGTVVLFLLGSVLQAGCHFLQFPTLLWCLPLFLAAAAAMFFYRAHTIFAEKADLGRIKAGAFLQQIAAFCLAGLLIAAGLFAFVVRPMAPPTRELRLITVLKSMETLKVLGVSSVQTVLDPNQTSELPPDKEDTTRDEGEEAPRPEPTPPEELTDSSDHPQQTIDSDLQQIWTAIRYGEAELSRLWLLLLIPLGIAALFLLRYLRRKRWRRRVQALPRQDGVVNYYRFFLKRLERLGLMRSGIHTLNEYVDHHRTQLEPFEGFEELTAVYQRTLYGRCPVSDGEWRLFEAFYDKFYPRLRREKGAVRFWLTAWRY